MCDPDHNQLQLHGLQGALIAAAQRTAPHRPCSCSHLLLLLGARRDHRSKAGQGVRGERTGAGSSSSSSHAAAQALEGAVQGLCTGASGQQRHTEEHGLQHACIGVCIRMTVGEGILSHSHRAKSWWCCARCSSRLRPLCTLAGCKTLIRRPTRCAVAGEANPSFIPASSCGGVQRHHHQERPCSCSHLLLLLLLLLCAGAGEHHGRGSAVKACARKAQRQGAEAAAAENASAVKSAAELRAAAQ